MRDARNWAIGILGALVLALGFALLRSTQPKPELAASGDRPTASLLDTSLDRENLRYIDLLFDRPLGEKLVGQTLETAPARIAPETGGVWRWQGANVLRFESSSYLVAATEYVLTLEPALLAGESFAWSGPSEARVVTDRFQVDRVEIHEEPEPSGRRRIRLRGALYFNYPVLPEQLAPRLRLEDAKRGEKIELQVESVGARQELAWRSAAFEKLGEERELRLSVGADLTSAQGNVPLGAEFVQAVPIGSGEKLAVRGVQATPGEDESTVQIELSSELRAEDAQRALRVEPAVKYTLRPQRNLLVLRGAFRPGERYELGLAAGLTAADGARLGEEWKHTLRLPDLPQSVDFEGQGMFLSASGPRSLMLESVNAPRVELSIERVYRNNVLYLLEQEGWRVWNEQGWGEIGGVYGERIAQATLEPGSERNKTLHTQLALDDYVSEHEPGLYRVVAGQPDAWQRAQRWVLVTDLGVVAKKSRDALWVWVASFRDLAPVAGARVRLISAQNQVIAEGRSDARGALVLSDLPNGENAPRPALVEVLHGDDWSFLPLDATRVDTSLLDVGGASASAAGYEAFLYGERDLYRPGETLRGAALVRDADLGVPPDMPVVLRHRDPEGRLRSETRAELAGGMLELELPLPDYEQTGHHQLELLIGDAQAGVYDFQVEEFLPDRIEVAIEPAKPEAGPGESLPFSVKGAYLFGAPAAGLPVETRVRLLATPFRPPGFDAYSFGNPERDFTPREILTQTGALDAEGRAALAFEVPAGLETPQALDAEISARVQEEGGRGVTARTHVRVHPTPYYLGLRRGTESYAEPGAPQRIEFVAVKPDGTPTPAGTLRAELYEDRWQTVLRRTASGSYRYESIREAALISWSELEPGSAQGSVELVPPDTGRYRAVLTDPDSGASSELIFYAGGYGFAPWALEQPAHVEVALQREDWRAGERAVVQVRAPFAGTLLLGVERERVLHWETHELKGNTATLEIPVQAEWQPNVYVTATVLRSARGLAPGEAARAFGAASLRVARGERALPVAIEAPEELRPEGPLEIAVRAAPGAKLTVAAVDEGILQLVAQETPDPLAFFTRKRALDVSSHDVFALLLPEWENAKPAGGGDSIGARAQFVRTESLRRVKPVAFWSGVLVADASGVARARFELPAFEGALRVMAIAHSDSRFGSGDKRVRVKSPLVLLPTFPRFLSFEERAEIPLSLRNDTGRPGRFEISLAAEGAARVEGEAKQAVEIAPGTQALVTFSLVTGASEGPLELRAQAQGNGESAHAEATLGVRADLPPVRLEQAGAVDAATFPLGQQSLETLRTEGRTLSLRISPVPLVRLAGKLEALLHYPYGCLEQTVSQSFPLLYIGAIARQLEPKLFEEHDPDALVAAGLARVASMRVASGGFSLWQGGSETDVWASLYATHFLVEAERAGHALPAGSLLDDALEWTAGEAKQTGDVSRSALERAAYALYVLARAGRADVASMDALRERHAAKLPKTSRALLGSAYAATGDRELLEELTRGVDDAETVRRQTGGNFASTTRDRALLLLALLDASPDDPRINTLAGRLGRDAAQETWWSTQETGMALLALGQLFTRQAARAPYAGELWSQSSRIERFGSETFVRDELPAEPLELRMDAGYEPGAAFYSLVARGVPTDASFAPAAQGIELARELSTRDGAALGEVAQGDLLIWTLRLRSSGGRIENVVATQLLPSGLEVENARLSSSETLPQLQSDLSPDHLDVRDDRLLLFVDLPDAQWHTYRALLRAVTPGRFRLPPAQAEAMYDASLRATGERGELEVKARR